MAQDYQKANQALWNEWTEIHARSEFYDLPAFKAGKITLQAYEREEVGNVARKFLLHLQCHFGMDTLSWARLGAKVTGVDFSDRAIDLARSLGLELGIPAQFVCSDIYDLPKVLSGKYDIVYTSHGVLPWLPDLQRWGEVIAHFLKPGGVFYMAESHPFGQVFDDEATTGLQVKYPYFHSTEPMVFQVQGSYADRDAKVLQAVEYEWAHCLGEIINALISAGLRIEFLHEFPFIAYPMLPALMERGGDGLWRLKQGDETIPFTFSIRATK